VEALYNRFIVWQHWRWIEREIRSGGQEATHAWG
jgi:hypothetical protein